MIITLTILASVIGGWVSYRLLFYDSSDFQEGLERLDKDEDDWIWPRIKSQHSPEDFEDESWSSGIRAFIFLAVSIGCGILTYYGLNRLFS
jgi:hypothetical protein